MRTKIVAGNWKMNKTATQTTDFCSELIQQLKNENTLLPPNTKVVICPPFTNLYHAHAAIQTANLPYLQLGAQNCHHQHNGAYTGDISAEMLQNIGIQYVIIGHSERRQYYSETNQQIFLKIQQAIQHQLQVIFCCGENLEQRQQNQHFDIIKQQLTESLFAIAEPQIQQYITIAYEPVWAIGTGQTATPQQAEEIHHYIRSLVTQQYSGYTANEVPILYGGSCNASNAAQLFQQPNIDGGLIGGAALKTFDFIQIIKAL